jgi:hypothetical protein
MTKALLFISFIAIFGTHSFLSAAEIPKCFQQEYNFRSKQRFANRGEYEAEKNWWKNKAPEVPNLIVLILAYNVYESEKKTAVSLKSDKKAHCYIGCRICQETSYLVADYTGWLKEDRDLRDCKYSTHYDEADYLATLQGARIGENPRVNCLELCGAIDHRN